MQREIIIISIILIVVVFFNFFTQKYTSRTIGSISSRLEEIKDLAIYNIQNNTTDSEINKKTDDILNDWNKINKKLALYIEHDELEKVDSSFVEFKENLQLNKYEEAVPEISKCMYILSHIQNKQSFKAINLF